MYISGTSASRQLLRRLKTHRLLNFDRLWKINRTDIIAHIADFAADGDIDGPVPVSILKWPGRKNPESLTANGFELPDQPLAPFIDRNGNGIYEPKSGDYPQFLGDQAIWWVFNDEGGDAIHGETNATAIGAEVQAMAYAFKGENDEDLANTTFYDFTIINRANENIDNLYTSLWFDDSFGCSEDDYFGCISAEKIAFLYNQDALDGSSNCECYCDNIPITGIKILDGPKNEAGVDVGFSSFTYFNNNGFSGLQPATTDPVTGVEFYNYMTGYWRDGTPFSYGGTGYNVNGLQPYNYAFDGNPSDVQSWSMCNNDQISQYDQRLLISSGPFKLEPGARTSVSYAVMTKFGIQYPCPDITPLIEMGRAIETFHAGLTPTDETPPNLSATYFYPNPLLSEGKLTANGEALESVRLFSLDGRIVREYNHLNTQELTIERGGLPIGFYLYSVLLRNGQLASGKIVVQ